MLTMKLFFELFETEFLDRHPRRRTGGFRMHAQAHTPFPGVILRDPAPGMKQVLRSQLFLAALIYQALSVKCV